MTKPLLAQPGTVMAAIDAMKTVIRQQRQGKREKAKDEARLEVIKKVLIGDT